MKSRIQFFIAVALIILLAGIAALALSGPNQERAQVFPASINRDCAPWDGAAFAVSIPLSGGASIELSIYQSPDIRLPIGFSFPDETMRNGNALLLLPVGEPEPLTGKVSFQRVEQGVPAEGVFNLTLENGIHFKGRFKAEWGNEIVYCG